MRPIRNFALTLCLLALAARPARAEGFFTPFVGYNFGGDSSNCASLAACDDKRTNFGVSFGTMGAAFGFEEDVAFAQDFFGKVPGKDTSVFTAMSNLLIGIGGGPVRPYFLVGVGLIRPHTSLDVTQFTADKNSLGYDIGGGVNAFFSKHLGVRGDVRHLETLQDVPFLGSIGSQIFVNQKLDFWRASIGLTLR